MKAILENYDTKSLYLMLLKWHHHLHLLVEFKTNIANRVEKYHNLDIF
jgi:hypothetical protein